jgi:hypothetical protein
MRYFLVAAALILSAQVQAKTEEAKPTETKATEGTPRKPAQQSEMVDLRSVVSSQNGYWFQEKPSGKFYGRFSAYLVADQAQDNHTLKVYVEKDGLEAPKTNAKIDGHNEKLPWLNDDSKFVKLVENAKFVWGSDWGGTQPSLELNGRGSLKIVSQNEGIGRSAWTQSVVANITPDAQNPRISMIGFDYTDRDKLDMSWSQCSINFNTGEGKLKKQGPEFDENGKKLHPKVIRKEFKVSKKLMNLNDVTDEVIQALPCFK